MKSWRHQGSKAKAGKWSEIPRKKIKCKVLIEQWQKWSKVTIMQDWKVLKREGEVGFDFYFCSVLATCMIEFGKTTWSNWNTSKEDKVQSVDWTMTKMVTSYNNARPKSIKSVKVKLGLNFIFGLSWLHAWLSLGKLHGLIERSHNF